ncbi:hypothetical protein [Neolewinella antarctica]|uniref:Uncharacterized protein n=1 Tax=Neolewinella antarctica TaxID=442734 RepID=A0ABX0XG23_9BACT|nr:hypothetical protein [Neolewinella antarctica]NJC28100.1 hypothetical protein [Neolewinella antarctica]
MTRPETNQEPDLHKPPEPAPQNDTDSPRERLRDIIVVFVTYPITTSKRAGKVAESKPWLEFSSLLLKVGLAIYALYEAMN